jgi:hypothetical protein
VSRPRTDQRDLFRRVAAVLADDPAASANAVHRVLGGRRREVLRAVRMQRIVGPPDGLDGRARRFPNDEGGSQSPAGSGESG